VRRGWYAAPDTPDDLVTAVRVGGRLACVSAGAHYGWATPERHGVHVCVAENAARLRRPGAAAPHSASPNLGVVLHWGSPIAKTDRPRLITSRFETVAHLIGCLDPEHAVAALDSFLHSEPEHSTELEQWLSSLPAHILRELSSRSSLCESFLETIGRIRLERAGIVGAHQVEIDGVGRVDLVIDGRLVIEWDGKQHEESHEDDCRRDALLTSMGYHVLRFTYRLVMEEWHIVIAAVRAALARV
jgi:very-short-patch-repair endonuclease